MIMKIRLTDRSFLKLLDFTPEEIRYLLDLAHKLKEEKRRNKLKNRFKGKSLAMIFEKRSTRTRCAFETAFAEEGGHPVFLSTDDIQLGEKESVEDTARVLGRMFDAIQFRGFRQEHVEMLASGSGVPVYNGLTDEFHPTQILADFMTMEEVFGRLKGLKVVFVGDTRNNVAVSMMVGCAKMGIHFTALGPKSLAPDAQMVAKCREIAQSTGSRINITDNIDEAVDNADVIYTDVWASMGEESQSRQRSEILAPYQVNDALMEKTGKTESIFLHCLPAVKGQEVTESVIEGPRSYVWDEAENRKHTIKAVMVATLT